MSDNNKKTNIPYQKLNSAYSKLKKIGKKHLNDTIEFGDTSTISKALKNGINGYTTINSGLIRSKMPPIKYNWKLQSIDLDSSEKPMTVDEPYNVLSDNSERKCIKGPSFGSMKNYLNYLVPSKSQAFVYTRKYTGKELVRYPLEDKWDNLKSCLGKVYRRYDEADRLKAKAELLYKKIQELANEIIIESENISTISGAYLALEKAAKNEFINKKTGKEMSDKAIAKKYAALVKSLNKKLGKEKGTKEAKRILGKILKKTNSKISKSKIISYYNKYIGGNSSTKSISSRATKLSAIGGTVVSTGRKSSLNASNKKNTTKKSNKSKKGKRKGNVVSVSAQAIVKLTTKINNGANNKIEQAQLDLDAKIRKIEIDRDVKIANIEAERDKTIANLYNEAGIKINNIDATDSDAKEKIAAIKEQLIQDIDSANQDANMKIEQAKEDAEKQIQEATNATEEKIAKINAKRDKALERIAEKGTSKKTDTIKDLEAAAKETPQEKAVSTASIEEANTNKVEANNALDGSRTGYNNDLTAKEQEIMTLSTEQTDSVVDTPVVDEGTSTTEQTIVYTTEPDTSSNSTSSYNDSGNVSTSSSTNSYSPAGEEVSEVLDTPIMPDTEESTIIPDNPNISDDMEVEITDGTTSEIVDTPNKNRNSSNVAIPIGLGVAAAGAAAVAGVRFVKNRKQNSGNDEETYDDENNGIAEYESDNADSEYMKDDYLGPSGSIYTDVDYSEDDSSEIPDDTKYTDAESIENQLDDNDDFSDDEVLNGLG